MSTEAVFTNSVGSATSSPATLTTNAAPVVSTQPASVTVNAGQSATFTAAANGVPAPTVQWQVSTNGGSTYTNVSGATSGTLTVSGTTASQNGSLYRAVFTNTAGSTDTTAATLTVDYAPTVTTQPANASVISGATATFTVAASGNPAPTVQWQVSTNSGSTWTNDTTDAGNTTDTLTVASTTTSESGYQYRAVLTNSVGSATSNAATLTVALNTAPVVSSVRPNAGAPFGVTIITGRNLTSIQAVYFGKTPAWYLNSSSTQIIALVPFAFPATVDITVKTRVRDERDVQRGQVHHQVGQRDGRSVGGAERLRRWAEVPDRPSAHRPSGPWARSILRAQGLVLATRRLPRTGASG